MYTYGQSAKLLGGQKNLWQVVFHLSSENTIILTPFFILMQKAAESMMWMEMNISISP